MRLNLLSIIFLTISLTSCHHNGGNPIKQTIKECYGSQVSLSMFKTVYNNDKTINFEKFRAKYQYISLVYLMTDCEPCYEKYIEWHAHLTNFNPSNGYTVLFIVQGKSHEDFFYNLSQRGFDQSPYFVTMDYNYSFLDDNVTIPSWIFETSVVIDQHGKIVMVGSPFMSQSKEEEFFSIM